MATTKGYAWDFDRPSTPWMEGYETFSVGIFQWLVKASDSGLKKSKAVTRVLGYTAEPDRVFAKATELCARLNRESASAANPPSWLQKQYSIPRPAGMPVERKSDDFTASQVRAVRLRVMKELLLPAGFVVGRDASYVRRVGDQVHLINFQGSKYGHEYTVNLGFHYTFIPPLLQRQVQPLKDFHLPDCLLNTRIGDLLNAGGADTWFKYGSNHDQLASDLRLCAATCLAKFEYFSDRWRDAAHFLSDGSARAGIWCGREDLGWGWIQLRAGNIGAAEAILADWSDDRFDSPPPLYRWLEAEIEKSRRKAAQGISQIQLKSWVTND